MKFKKCATITAVQINLELQGGTIQYEKWGGIQTAKQGDWLIYGNGDTYTCDKKVFENTYEQVGPGEYRKTTTIEAVIADEDGVVKTIEGESVYKKGDYIVTNIGGDKYCIDPVEFNDIYVKAE